MSPLDDALRFAGFALAHAAWVISDLESGELLCPIGVVERGDTREVVPFEAESQRVSESAERRWGKVCAFPPFARKKRRMGHPYRCEQVEFEKT